MKKIYFTFTISLLILFSVFCGCTTNDKTSDIKEEELDGEIIFEYDKNTINSRFGFMHPDDFHDMAEMGIFWQRPHPGPFIWGQIEKESGIYNWDDCDKEVKRSQKYGANIIATIWPFADWDQSSCHSKAGSISTMIFSELGKYRQKPCDMEAYTDFIKKLVERYDGDRNNDMPDLVVPIKYWEVSNEPSMQEDFHTFFVGSAKDYFDILNATYQAVKDADSQAIIVKGGMAGVMDDHSNFWSDVFDIGGANYFDIGNIHSINSQSDGVNAPEYKDFLDEEGIDKPFWVTEVELGEMDKEKDDYKDTDMHDLLITNFVLAFYSGAEKIFHPCISKTKSEGKKESTYNALNTIIDKIDYFESVERLDEDKYKFSLEENVVYVFWGENVIPEEVTSQVKMTDSSGVETILNATELILTNSPIFVEKI
jgi:hypothetical protein